METLTDEESEELAKHSFQIAKVLFEKVPKEWQAITIEWILTCVLGRSNWHDRYLFPPVNLN